ncbi:MAG TPA: leucyl/phenylalanyl-tRNA--protein transferase [Alphaproteobacteria bacterium]|jgi:leucyl/phenylalanyl-tRNA--protein transferase|nr:MAG: leucyl/phenylalanyl-tRNA--protein transferase [SAR116 cluster bacterium MED-G05]HAO56879.1 leucyl/phenylalanyl-tRNA--protein transferase [Alphaproteobacteria bacterium]HBD51659.1 leucyl/phenylalanyl-tRNA--protein transferase [Alphaproteobacteria bacterium]HBP60932.1 leucyl/phenylalanyl-tRNA--protein transferase [Alphaproteobacteria bacterium]HBP72021.1 leucyl/phenylalanyl-tRNA--protein transferase [Alphaproteobacteria bacterium]|tara:strand:+ start:783 stop:1460 length:678 start_codon:yes stop_codon:yes gene_type:complete
MAERFAFSPETLIKAYSLGVFPMADSADSQDIRFYDPDVRALIPLGWHDGRKPEFHLPRRLARTVKRHPFMVTFDRDFAGVITQCAAPSQTRADTWINADIRALYIALHKLGFAHSVEVWEGKQLVGGLYGVALRAAFFGESMFSRRTDASKIALVHLVARLRTGGFELLDAQFSNDHLLQFGIYELPRERFQQRLAHALSLSADLHLETDSRDLVDAMLAEAQR